jgi:uncharacterized protein (UPF0333 family)
MRKGQTALEYLMTYGWAILVVIIVVAVLYYMGFTKPCRFTGTQVTGFGQAFISGVKMTVNAAGKNELSFILKSNIPGDAITITNIKMSHSPDYEGASDVGGGITLSQGESRTITITQTAGTTFAVNDCYAVDVEITYNQGGATGLKIAGSITGLVV